MIGSSTLAGSVMKIPWAIAFRARSRSLISVSARRLGAMSLAAEHPQTLTSVVLAQYKRRWRWRLLLVGVFVPLALLVLALFGSATFLSLMSWDENYHLFILGALSFACGWFGRSALRHRWRYWVRLRIAGMGLSYILMLIAFYVDNGKQLPVWKDLPHFM